MEGLQRTGRIFFALALIGLGVEHFIFRAFVTGRAPAWPSAVPGGEVWAYVTGIAFIILGAALIAGRHARLAAVLTAALIFAWSLLRHIPVVAADSAFGVTWTMAGKALTFTGGALALAATMPAIVGTRDTPLMRFVNLRREFIVAGRISLGLFLIVTGVQHYIFTPFVASLVPAWIPGGGIFWTYVAGVALITFGAGLLIPPTARVAALLAGLMVFSWFWIVHLPRTFDGISSAIATFEALAVSGIGFALAASSINGHPHV